MIYITGDTHGDAARFVENNMGDAAWTEEDVLIVCGDFGFVFTGREREEANLNLLAQKPYTICFCDGNHENFPLLFSYPEELWCGGRVHRLRKNILHLMRGEIYEIQGKKVFAMGGAYSIDREFRVLGRSWWKEELPSEEECDRAWENLESRGMKVDLVVSHTAPAAALHAMGKFADAHEEGFQRFLRKLYLNLEFERWYFGHWHEDKKINDLFTAVFLNVLPVSPTEEWGEGILPICDDA